MADQDKPTGIERIVVQGFKSMRDRVDVAIRPLTILAGQNSAGKSTRMQPLLLMKQSLEVAHEPDPLLLLGDCVQVTDANTLFWKGKTRTDVRRRWSVILEGDFHEGDHLLHQPGWLPVGVDDVGDRG